MTASITDPRPVLRKALGTAADVIAGVDAGQFGDPTPCDDFTVRDLLAHVVGVARTAAATGRGENPFEVPQPEPASIDDYPAVFADAVAEWEAAWADGTALTQPTPLPWATESGAAALCAWVGEFTVHTWDLARATGQSPAWDPEVLHLAAADVGDDQFLPATGRHELFDQMRDGADFPDPFLDAFPVPDDASELDRIVAWTGRDPSWSRP